MSGANIKRLMDPEILAAIMDSATDGLHLIRTKPDILSTTTGLTVK
mgnify:CR=1 FL=1